MQSADKLGGIGQRGSAKTGLFCFDGSSTEDIKNECVSASSIRCCCMNFNK